MKVTAKKPCVSDVFKVVEEGERFYIVCGDTIGSYRALPKDEYEPVQEWVDVTRECCATNVKLRHGGIDIHPSSWFGNGHYRLRKIDTTASGYPHPTYFIVERKGRS